ncbi:hypothetical protein, partial [Neisseria dentiae]|uniref:hypothetical protein n=1 Tax=Neisseria dentiae TaxID=194197 RepID=UPI00211CFF00
LEIGDFRGEIGRDLMFFNRKFRYEAAGYEESHIRLFFAKVSGVENSSVVYTFRFLFEDPFWDF